MSSDLLLAPLALFLLEILHRQVTSAEPISSPQQKTYSMSQSDHLELVSRARPLLENKTLVVCVVVREPFVIFDNQVEALSKQESNYTTTNDLDNYKGVAIEVIKRLAVIFRFKIKIITPEDKQFGIQLPGGRWTGLLGSLVRNESDIGITALSITVSRVQAIDFTRAYYVETAAMLLPIPEEIQNYFAILQPFSLAVWFLLLATIIILILLITIMSKLEEDQCDSFKRCGLAEKSTLTARRATRTGSLLDSNCNRLTVRNNRINDSKRVHGSGSITWLERLYYATSCVLNILLIRDIKEPPKQTPIRILVCVWWLSTIVIVNMYLGILFAQLVVPRQPLSIETLEELVSQEKVKWCVTRGSALDELFRYSAADTIYGQLGRRMLSVSSADEGVERVKNSGWAFIRERSMLEFKVAQEHNRIRACRLQLARRADFFSVGFGIALRKGSVYLEPFNSALTLLIEHGLLSRWQSMYWPTRNRFTECRLQPLREGEPLSVKHFISIYLICSLVIACSASVLLYQSCHEHLLGLAYFSRWRRLRLPIGLQRDAGNCDRPREELAPIRIRPIVDRQEAGRSKC